MTSSSEDVIIINNIRGGIFMKNLKKITIVAFALVIIFSFAACKKASPKEVVEKELKNIQTESVDNVDIPLVNKDTSEDKGLKEKYTNWIKMLQKFDYKIGEEKISKDGKTATVQIKLTTYNFGEAYKGMYNQLIEEAKAGKITSSTDIKKYTFDLMFDKMLALKDKEYSKDVIIKCTQNDGKWTTDIRGNQDFTDAMLGGMMTEASAVAGLI